jgi:hypothetical protein
MPVDYARELLFCRNLCIPGSIFAGICQILHDVGYYAHPSALEHEPIRLTHALSS